MATRIYNFHQSFQLILLYNLFADPCLKSWLAKDQYGRLYLLWCKKWLLMWIQNLWSSSCQRSTTPPVSSSLQLIDAFNKSLHGQRSRRPQLVFFFSFNDIWVQKITKRLFFFFLFLRVIISWSTKGTPNNKFILVLYD